MFRLVRRRWNCRHEDTIRLKCSRWRCDPGTPILANRSTSGQWSIFSLPRKANLRFYEAIKGCGATAASAAKTAKSARTTVGFAEYWGAEVADGAAKIRVVQNVLEINAKS